MNDRIMMHTAELDDSGLPLKPRPAPPIFKLFPLPPLNLDFLNHALCIAKSIKLFGTS